MERMSKMSAYLIGVSIIYLIVSMVLLFMNRLTDTVLFIGQVSYVTILALPIVYKPLGKYLGYCK